MIKTGVLSLKGLTGSEESRKAEGEGERQET